MAVTAQWRWPVAFAVQLLVMACSLIYQFAVLHTRVEERTQDRYTSEQAMADLLLRDSRLDYLRQELLRLNAEIKGRPPPWLRQQLLDTIRRVERLERINPYAGQKRGSP